MAHNLRRIVEFVTGADVLFIEADFSARYRGDEITHYREFLGAWKTPETAELGT